MAKKIAPIHPGETLLEEFLEPLTITQYRLAKDIAVPARRINEIVHGERAISADTALRLGRYFGTSAAFWLNLQTHYDLAQVSDVYGKIIVKTVKVRKNKQLSEALRNDRSKFEMGKGKKLVSLVKFR